MVANDVARSAVVTPAWDENKSALKMKSMRRRTSNDDDEEEAADDEPFALLWQ